MRWEKVSCVRPVYSKWVRCEGVCKVRMEGGRELSVLGKCVACEYVLVCSFGGSGESECVLEVYICLVC